MGKCYAGALKLFLGKGNGFIPKIHPTLFTAKRFYSCKQGKDQEENSVGELEEAAQVEHPHPPEQRERRNEFKNSTRVHQKVTLPITCFLLS